MLLFMGWVFFSTYFLFLSLWEPLEWVLRPTPVMPVAPHPGDPRGSVLAPMVLVVSHIEELFPFSSFFYSTFDCIYLL